VLSDLLTSIESRQWNIEESADTKMQFSRWKSFDNNRIGEILFVGALFIRFASRFSLH
jgi:hypothetical protein